MKDSILDLLGDAGTVEVAWWSMWTRLAACTQPANGQDPKQQNVHATLHDNKAPKTSTNVGCAGGAFIQNLSARNICAHILQDWAGHDTSRESRTRQGHARRQGLRYKVSIQVMVHVDDKHRNSTNPAHWGPHSVRQSSTWDLALLSDRSSGSAPTTPAVGHPQTPD